MQAAAFPLCHKALAPCLMAYGIMITASRMIQACPRAVGLTLPSRNHVLRFLPITLYLLNSLALLWLINGFCVKLSSLKNTHIQIQQ